MKTLSDKIKKIDVNGKGNQFFLCINTLDVKQFIKDYNDLVQELMLKRITYGQFKDRVKQITGKQLLEETKQND